MTTESSTIRRLRDQVRAADEEFHIAMACHEAWKPAAYDASLHERIGRSYAANTFLVVRHALRREMLLALMRLWDNSKRSLRLGAIASKLDDRSVLKEVTANYEAHWGGAKSGINPALQYAECEIGRQQARLLQEQAAEAIAIIRRYEAGGSGHNTLEKLRKLRHSRLAHRQIESIPVAIGRAAPSDEEIEAFYQDMARVIRLLLGVVEKTSYSPDDTAKIFRKNAGFFWAAVRGERTDGHPNYRSHSVDFTT